MSEINVTPFVDILLVLLVVFMITAPLLNSRLDVELPTGHSKKAESSETTLPLVLKVDAKTRIHFLETYFDDLDDLSQRLPGLGAELTTQPVHLQIDKRVQHGFLIKLMLALKNAGFEQVGLVFNEKLN